MQSVELYLVKMHWDFKIHCFTHLTYAFWDVFFRTCRTPKSKLCERCAVPLQNVLSLLTRWRWINVFNVHQCNVVPSCQWKCLDGVFTVMVRSTLGLKGTIHLKEDILKGKLVHCHFDPPLTSTARTKTVYSLLFYIPWRKESHTRLEYHEVNYVFIFGWTIPLRCDGDIWMYE